MDFSSENNINYWKNDDGQRICLHEMELLFNSAPL